jgi:hypothetical protein
MQKTILSKTDLYIQFTEDELDELNLEAGQNYDCELTEDGILLKPWKQVDLGDITQFPREVLEMLVTKSLEEGKTVNNVIVDILKSALDNPEFQDVIYTNPNETNTDVGIPGGQQTSGDANAVLLNE